MKIKTLYIYLFLSYIMVTLHAEPLKMKISGEAAILMNADTGAILFEKNAYDLHYPASTTKIATFLYAVHANKFQLDTPITAQQEALGTITPEEKRKSDYKKSSHLLETDASHIAIKRDEILSFGDLLKGMMIVSGDDASNVIAQSVSGSMDTFTDEMNDYVKTLGCNNTHFCNTHGLHHPDHQSTAYDLAILSKEALKNPLFLEIVSQTKFVRNKTNKQKASTHLQTNRLLRPGKLYYSKAIGVKTGYHSNAKNALVAAARYNDRTLIAVLLKYGDRNQMFQEAIQLFDAAFNQPKVHHTFLKEGPQTFTHSIRHAKTALTTYLAEDVSLDYYPSEDPEVKGFLSWKKLPLPISKGQIVGEIQLISKEGTVVKASPLLAQEDVFLSWPFNWLASINRFYKTSKLLAVSLFVCLTGLFIYSAWSWLTLPRRG